MDAFSHFRAEPRHVRWALALAALVSLVAAAANATLIFDDPFLYEAFANGVAQYGVLRTAFELLLNLDLHAGVPEYRSYGLSKVLHFGLWFIFGANAWLYSAFIALTQALTAVVIYAGLLRARLDSTQSLLAALTWMLSPFAVTTCFHHYSYLILPTQVTVVLAWLLYRSVRRAQPLLQAMGFVAGGVALALTGESHLVLAGCLLGLVAWAAAPREGLLQACARYALVMGSTVVTLVVHRMAWIALGPENVTGRFVFSNPGLREVLGRTGDFALSVSNGALVQIEKVLGYSHWSWMVFLVGGGLGALLYVQLRRAAPVVLGPSEIHGRYRLLVVGALLVLASLAVSWTRQAFFSVVGPVLPRRYGYMPYTVLAMAIVVILSSPSFRRRATAWMAPTFVAGMLGLWCALQIVCLPTVRYQDRIVWRDIEAATAGKRHPVLLFVNAWNAQRPLGYDAPGLRGTHFPPIFESPFMRYWWQAQYARVGLGMAGTGNALMYERDGGVTLSGQVGGVHFLPTLPVVADAASVVAVVETGHEVPEWRDGLQAVKVIASWADFRSTAAYLQTRIDVGWSAFLHEIFNLPAAPFMVDAGQRNNSARPDVWPDKRFGEPLGAGARAAGVLDYGLESGDDDLYLPGGKSGEPLAYLTSNRHGNFTYRIDFAEPASHVLSLDFMDGWSQRPGARVMHIQVELDGRWYDLGDLDTYAVGGNAPFALRIPAHGVRTVRLRFEKSAASQDIPLLNGIRLQPLP